MGSGKKKGVRADAPQKDERVLELLRSENEELRGKYSSAIRYIRDKVNQLLTVMGTLPIKPEELDDKTLLELDPVGIISDSFVQILDHLHKTNQRLKITNHEIQAIFDSAGMGILVLDSKMHILAYNKKLKDSFFKEKNNITGHFCYKAICNSEIPVNKCPFKKIFKTGEPLHQQEWTVGNRSYNIVGTPIKDDQGNMTRAVLVYMDITGRIRAEETLRKSEEKYRDLFENANDLIQSVGADGSILYVNRAWCDTLGYHEDEIPGLSIFDIIHPECDDCNVEFKSIVYGERTGRIVTQFVTKDGRTIIVEGNVNTIYEKGKFAGTRGIFRDITESKKSEELIASERERLAVTLRSIGDGVITTDTKGKVILVNKVAEKLTGWKQNEAEGKPLAEVFHIINEATRMRCDNPVGNVLKGRKVTDIAGHSVLIGRDGSERIVTDSIAPIIDKNSTVIGYVLVFHDITLRQKMENDLLKKEKLESLGIIAGGIAHDFNNLLNGIMGNIDLALTKIAPGDEVYRRLSQAEKATLRARDLTSRLLTFSKGGAPIRKAASIRELIKDTADFVLGGTNIKSEFSLPEDLWYAEIDEGQISQVINNLVMNAVQAMPEGGPIRICAENAVIGPSEMPLQIEGNFVKITIKDSGTGIPKENLNRIFEPYFTTKQSGNGLGLATTYSIVKSHSGHIEVESDEGKGTVFSIYLPALTGPVEIKKNIAEDIPSGTGKGKILLMDDEELIRDTVGTMLGRIGYSVECALDGRQALQLYRKAKESGKPFDAVILDLTIPGGMGGKDAIRELLAFDPGVKAIVSSGYSSDPIMANYRQYGFSGVVAKPYKMNDLNKVLFKVL